MQVRAPERIQATFDRENKLDFDFLQGTFDLQTIRLLSGSGPDVTAPHEGMVAFIAGEKTLLFNAYDALEMALRDELVSSIPDQALVDLACELMLDDFVRAKDEVCGVSDLDRWFTAANIAAACMMELILPSHLIGRISCRLRECFGGIRNLVGSGDTVLD